MKIIFYSSSNNFSIGTSCGQLFDVKIYSLIIIHWECAFIVWVFYSMLYAPMTWPWRMNNVFSICYDNIYVLVLLCIFYINAYVVKTLNDLYFTDTAIRLTFKYKNKKLVKIKVLVAICLNIFIGRWLLHDLYVMLG